MQENIIVKPSVEKQFDRFLRQGRALFFSAPCGFGKTAVAEALLSGREVLRLSADSADFSLPSAEADWQILLLDDLQDMQEEQDWNALCELIRTCPDRRFVLLSRGTPPGSLMAFQYTGLMTVLEALDWDGDKAWRKRLMAAVRTQAAFYPHFLEPRLAPGEELTPTELQILHLLCADKSNAEIARIMDVKLPTVKTHVSHILDKLDVKRRAEAKTAAKKLHLVPEDL